MKVIRSTKCSLKFATTKKRIILFKIISDYGKIVNQYIDIFWANPPSYSELLKPIIDKVKSDYSFRFRKVAAREAVGMILSVKERWKNNPEKASKPTHRGERIFCSSTLIELEKSDSSFDYFLKIRSVGFKIKLDLPIKSHKHFNELKSRGARLNSYVITKKDVQFCFEIETGPKKQDGKTIGIDSGIKCLATTHDGQRIGDKIESIIQSINRCKTGSGRQEQLRRYLLHYINFTAKEILKQNKTASRIVVERLKNMNFKAKIRRKGNKALRRTIGSWNYRYWLTRVERACEDNRVSFTSVNPFETSIRCNSCGHSDRANRSTQSSFLCILCGHADHADVNAAKNILDRGTSLVYRRGK